VSSAPAGSARGIWHLTTPEKAARRPRPRGKKGPKEAPYAPGSRARELKERAKKDPGDYSKWLAKRRSVVNFARGVAQIEPMIFWKHTPEDEIVEVMEELLDAYEAVTRALRPSTFGYRTRRRARRSRRWSRTPRAARSTRLQLRRSLPPESATKRTSAT
jgi:hypothetical protein